MASKMENRISYLESQLSTSLESLDAFSVQLTVIQDFLQKQFGSRFVDYAITRGIFIDKAPPSSRGMNKNNNYYNNMSGGDTASASSTKGEGYNSYVDEMQEEEEEDPLALVEIETFEGHEGEDDDQYNQQYWEEEGETNSDNLGDNGQSNLRIVNCVSEKIKKENSTIRLPSPPPITPRPPAARTYTKSNTTATEQKPRPPGNFLGRKRPALTSNLSSSAPPTKMPVLHPQGNFCQVKQETEFDMLDFSNLTDGDVDSLLTEGKTIDSEYNEDLRDYYSVLPDKSVQCKICDKVLKAGWHKFGRHYRTHTGEKPFSCPICSESFARKDNMNNHIKSKHENKRPRPNIEDSELLVSDFSSMYYLPSELC